ncbi:MAG: metallophosphoesterase [Thermoleophilaceae bacterium]
MTTAIASDLHIGAASPGSVLTSHEIRRRLVEALAEADQVVLLGDVLELRQAPLGRVLEAARPFFSELGEALGGKRVILVPGNHDHHLIAWEREHGMSADGAEPEPARPSKGGPLATLAAVMGDADLRLGYPGIRLRDDVWATHGHYLDAHNTVPALETLAVAMATRRVKAFRAEDALTPADYERALTPLYGIAFRQAQRRNGGRAPTATNPSTALWRMLEGPGGRARFGRLLGGVAVPVVIGSLNAAGLGPFKMDFSGRALRLGSIHGMSEVVRRLGIDAGHVVFGHTHRTGPLERDPGWNTPDGVNLYNSGNWVYERAFLGPSAAESPYWPGTIIVVDDSGAPVVRRLLEDVSHDELAAAAAGSYAGGGEPPSAE